MSTTYTLFPPKSDMHQWSAWRSGYDVTDELERSRVHNSTGYVDYLISTGEIDRPGLWTLHISPDRLSPEIVTFEVREIPPAPPVPRFEVVDG